MVSDPFFSVSTQGIEESGRKRDPTPFRHHLDSVDLGSVPIPGFASLLPQNQYNAPSIRAGTRP